MSDTCRSCNAPLLFVRMPSGKSNPLNAEPHEKGNVRVRELVANVTNAPTGHFDGVVLSGEVLAEARAKGEKLFLSHFADCKSAASWRRR